MIRSISISILMLLNVNSNAGESIRGEYVLKETSSYNFYYDSHDMKLVAIDKKYTLGGNKQ